MLVESVKNKEFRKVLQSTALNVPDSTGVLLGAKLTKQELPGRVPGVDLVISLFATLDESTPAFLLGAKDGVAGIAAKVLLQMNPKLKIVGTFSGTPNPEHAAGITQVVHQSGAKVLLVAFGAPKQDVWIRKYLQDMPNIHVAMGVGGTFDFLSGNVKRAPAWMRKAGLEWVFRVLQEPKRLGRIMRATVVYCWYLLIRGRK